MKGQNAKNFLQLGWRLCIWFFIILAIQQVLEKYHAVSLTKNWFVINCYFYYFLFRVSKNTATIKTYVV